MNEITATIEIEIPYFDVDSMAITWHGHYVKYFEMVRCALLAKIDYDYKQMKDSGYAWPIVKLDIKYVKPSLFKQIVLVEATLVEYEHRLKIKYIIKDKQSGALLTKASTTQMAINIASQEACFVSPKVFTDKVEAYPCEK